MANEIPGTLNQFGNENLPGVRAPEPVAEASPEMLATDDARNAAKIAGPDVDANGKTILERIRADHPDTTKDDSDYTLARGMYDSLHKDGEPFGAFAKRFGVQQSPLTTAANEFGTTATLHLNEPVESTVAGLKSLLDGGGFMPGYRAKGQELADMRAVGQEENPWSGVAGKIGGTVVPIATAGNVLRGASDIIPGVKTMADKGPLADAIAKFATLTGLDRGVDSVQRDTVNDSSLGRTAVDAAGNVGLGALEGGAGAVVGSGIGKGLSAVAGPITSSIGRGMSAADQYLAGVPRTLYTKAAAKLSDGFNGAADTPTVAGQAVDNKFYDELLSKSALDVPKAVTQLTALIKNDPGMASLIMDSAEKHAPAVYKDSIKAVREMIAGDDPGGPARAAQLFTDIATLSGTDMQAAARQAGQTMSPNADAIEAAKIEGSPVAVGEPPVNGHAPPDNANGSQTSFLANIYKDLIPRRLEGPIDPLAAFQQNTITGGIRDKGKLIEPPVTGMGRLGQALYERWGGGPGQVVGTLGGSLGGAPIESLGGLLSRFAQPPSMLVGKGGGAALQGIGKTLTAIGEPGTAADAAMGTSYTRDLPSIYSFGAHGAPPVFPDVFTPPPAEEKHSEVEPADVKRFVASADPQQITAYVGQRLGPQIASQIPSDPEGHAAALNALLMNPAYSRVLLG